MIVKQIMADLNDQIVPDTKVESVNSDIKNILPDLENKEMVSGVKEVLPSSGQVVSNENLNAVNQPVNDATSSQPPTEQVQPQVAQPVVTPIPPLPEGTLPPRAATENVQVTPLPAPIIKKKKEVEKKSRIIWGDIISCWVLGVATLLILLIILLFVVVKAGILNVPYLSERFYNPPLPYHFVVANTMSWSDFNKIVSTKLTEEGLDSEPPLDLQLTEQEFTGLLQGVVLNGLRSSEYKAEVAQVTFLPESIELYFYLTWHDYLTFEILTHLVPVVENDGTLRLEVVDARFGDLPLPGSWVINLIGYFFARDVGVWQIILSNGYGIQSATLSTRFIDLFIGPVNVK